MKGYWSQLRPLEKRMVVGVLSVLFIVLNFWFVVPHFSDWAKVQVTMENERKKLATYEAKIQQVPKLKAQVASLEDEGLAVPPEDQISHFSGAIQSEAVRSGVRIDSTGKITTRTNQFFVEQTQTLGVQAKEQALVDFLFNLGSGNSLIRVRDLTLRPESQRHELVAQIKLVASYQKKASVRNETSTQTPAVKPAAPASKPPQSTQAPSAPAQKPSRPKTADATSLGKSLPGSGKPGNPNKK